MNKSDFVVNRNQICSHRKDKTTPPRKTNDFVKILNKNKIIRDNCLLTTTETLKTITVVQNVLNLLGDEKP